MNSKVYKHNLTSKRFSSSFMRKKVELITNEAKKENRSDISLEEWQKYGYSNYDWCQYILKNPPVGELQVDYAVYNELSVEDFQDNYERLNKPLIIQNSTNEWKANSEWNFKVK